MGDDEIGVVEKQVNRGLRQKQTGNPAGNKQGNESNGKEHRAGELNLSAPERAQPVEGLDGGRHADGHGQQRKRKRGIGAHAADEHVVAPHAEAEETDSAEGVDHGAITEHRLAREGREDVRGHAHAGQNGDVHLGMAEEPEQVLPEERGAALVIDDLVGDDQAAGNEEAGSRAAVEQQQNARCQQNAKGQQTENRGDEPRPAGQRHAHQFHALGAQINDRGDEIEGAHQRGGAEDGDAHDPQRLSGALTRAGDFSQRAEGRIAGPPGNRCAPGNEKRSAHYAERKKCGPERQHVQNRKGHVGSANLDGQNVVAKSGLRRRGEHHKDHDRAVHGEQRQILLGRDLAALGEGNLQVRPGQMHAHQERKRHPQEHREQGQAPILYADDLVVQAEDVLANPSGWRRVSVMRRHRASPRFGEGLPWNCVARCSRLLAPNH